MKVLITYDLTDADGKHNDLKQNLDERSNWEYCNLTTAFFYESKEKDIKQVVKNLKNDFEDAWKEVGIPESNISYAYLISSEEDPECAIVLSTEKLKVIEEEKRNKIDALFDEILS